MNFIDELKRRNVFKVGLAYLALGWVVVQVTSMAVPALNLPESLNAIVFYMGIIGFPFAIFFAWAFELTPDGMKKTTDVDPSHSVTSTTGQKLNFIIMGLMAIGLTWFSYDKFISVPNEAASETRGNDTSIAVLPFMNMSDESSNQHFSDGISEEILNVLAQIPNLHVTSRSSAFQFRGNDINIPTVAKKLGVANVLEGSVRRDGARIRITAQLIDAKNDKHLWSETYDRDLLDIFAVQDEISNAIVDALKIHLLGETAPKTVAATDNIDAYNSYLIGRERMALQTKDDFKAATMEFEEAVKLDPKFASAHAQLVLAALGLERLSDDKDEDDLKRETDKLASLHLEKAQELAPNLPEVLAIKGLYALKRFKYEVAEAELNRAIQLNPNYAQAYLWRADVAYNNSDFKAMLDDRETAYRLDPMSLEISKKLAYDYRSFWRPDDAEKIIKRMYALHPNHLEAYDADLANLGAQGLYVEMIKVATEGLKYHADSERLKGDLAWALISVDEDEKALTYEEDWVKFIVAQKNGWDNKTITLLNDKLASGERADYLWAASDYYRKIEDKIILQTILQERIVNYETRGYPWNSSCNMYLIEEMRFAKMPENTDKMMAKCRERTEERVKAGYLCPCSWFMLVAFAILDERYNDAVFRANEWLDKGDYSFDLETDPIFSHLKNHPDYKKLIQRNRDSMARQRRLYLAMVEQ